MTVTRKMTWFTGSLILLALATAAAESFAGGGPDCPYEKQQRTITKTEPATAPVEAQKPAKSTPAQSPAPAQKQTPAQVTKRSSNAPA
jgi:hypothetical protein